MRCLLCYRRVACFVAILSWSAGFADEPSAPSQTRPSAAGSASSSRLAAKAIAEIRSGDYDKGMANLLRAIDRNPDDRGKSYDPLAKEKLSVEALKHGTDQLRQMLQDRPIMKTDADGPLAKWALRRFAGQGLGFTIDWDLTPPDFRALAETALPTRSTRGAIRIANKRLLGPSKLDRGTRVDRPFEALWAVAVFELHNITYHRQFQKIHNDAVAGRISRVEYIVEMFRIEHLAMQQTRAFYCRVFLPWAKKKRFRSDPTLWYTNIWGGPKAWLRRFDPKNEYPWKVYSRQYDMARSRAKQR